MKLLIITLVLTFALSACVYTVEDIETKICEMIEDPVVGEKPTCKGIELTEVEKGKYEGTVTTELNGEETVHDITVEVNGGTTSYDMKSR